MNLNELELSVRRCSYHSLLILVSKTLSCNGFGDIEIQGRRLAKQKSWFGGFDLLCTAQVGTIPVRIAVKVIQDSIRLRMLDEMAGVVTRMEVDFGVVVSPYRLIGKAASCRPRYVPTRVKAIDGRLLARMMAKHRIGLTQSGSVDHSFFFQLNAQSQRVLDLLAKTKK